MTAVLIVLTGCGGSGSPNTYSVGANVSGLSGSGLVLQINPGNDLAVGANGTYTLANSLAFGTAYQVAVKIQPASPQQTCAVSNGSGTIGASDVTVGVRCTTVTHSVGVAVSGLSGTGLVLQLNRGNDLSITTNGAATFPAAIDSGASYAVSVSSPPTHPRQACSVDKGSGTVGAADISGIVVTCVTAVTTLYSFTDPSPNGSLVQGSDGNLYGTTLDTVFRITLAGNETKLFSLDPTLLGPDTYGGSQGGLILANDGNLYGMARGGPGSALSGAIYEVTPAGTGTVVAAFGGVDDGDFFPSTSVTQGSDGLLYVVAKNDFAPGSIYGTTLTGQIEFATQAPGDIVAPFFAAPDGTLYGLSGSLFKFNPPSIQITTLGAITADIVNAQVALIDGKDGNLYSTSEAGGAPSATCPSGCGTVFRVTLAGVITVSHSFGASAADGRSPNGALILGSDGNFYGTTTAGGSSNSNCKLQSGCGTVYRITPAGVETVLYSFGANASDGVGPSGALVQASDGNLYGTTAAGGAINDGTFFKLDMGGN